MLQCDEGHTHQARQVCVSTGPYSSEDFYYPDTPSVSSYMSMQDGLEAYWDQVAFLAHADLPQVARSN
jgi:hypothetical protein